MNEHYNAAPAVQSGGWPNGRRPCLAGVATWEKEIMLERQREGVAKAKGEGKHNGRPASVDAAGIRAALAAGD